MEELTDSSFHATLEAESKLCLVDFYAPWCGPCKAIAPFLENLDQLYSNLKIFKVNIDESPRLSEEYKISSVPTFKFFKEGAPSYTQVGFQSPSAFEALIRVQLMNNEQKIL